MLPIVHEIAAQQERNRLHSLLFEPLTTSEPSPDRDESIATIRRQLEMVPHRASLGALALAAQRPGPIN